jgi:hypothetical protein
LEFFFVVGRFSFFHLTTDLFATSLNTSFITFSHNGGAVFGNGDAASFT